MPMHTKNRTFAREVLGPWVRELPALCRLAAGQADPADFMGLPPTDWQVAGVGKEIATALVPVISDGDRGTCLLLLQHRLREVALAVRLLRCVLQDLSAVHADAAEIDALDETAMRDDFTPGGSSRLSEVDTTFSDWVADRLRQMGYSL